jgi:hypothetical protein
MRAIDEHFQLWLERVQELTGGPVDPLEARIVFEIFDRPYKPISPEEYAAELMEKGTKS